MSASCCDPFLSVLSQDGQALVLALQDTSHQLTIIKTRIGELPGRAKSPFLTLCLYRDYSGLFTTEARLTGRRAGPGRPGGGGSSRPGPAAADLDEEDELLYGSSEAQVLVPGTSIDFTYRYNLIAL